MCRHFENEMVLVTGNWFYVESAIDKDGSFWGSDDDGEIFEFNVSDIELIKHNTSQHHKAIDLLVDKCFKDLGVINMGASPDLAKEIIRNSIIVAIKHNTSQVGVKDKPAVDFSGVVDTMGYGC